MNSVTYLSAILLGLLISSSSSQVYTEKLDVAIYYEALCGGCTTFFADQLVPNYDAFKDYINMSFLPFGNAKILNTSTGVTIKCQHGEDECIENMVQGCTLYYLDGRPDDQMKYTACQMKLSDRIGKKCAEEVNVSFEKVKDCMVSGLGTELQLEMERQTHAVPGYEGTPTITINKVNVEKAFEHFKDALCDALNNKPSACKERAMKKNLKFT